MQEIVDFTLASVEAILRNRRINSQPTSAGPVFRLLNKFLKTRIAAQRDPY